jgi:hypothetical protein
VDRGLVLQRVRPTLGGGDHVVNDGGTRPMADVADRVVAVEHVLRVSLLLPSAGGALAALRGGERLRAMDRAGLILPAARVAAQLPADPNWHD